MIKKEDIGIILSVCIILYLIYDKFCPNNKIEHMSSFNEEALSNLASMYQSGKMVVDEIEVQKDIKVKGNINIDGEHTVAGKSNLNGNVYTGQVVLGKTKLGTGTNTSLKVQTDHGWGEFGPQNADWCHIVTDRPKVYTNKQMHINGQISTYNKDGIDDTRRLKGLSRIGGFAVDGTGTTMMLEEGSYDLNAGKKYDAWTNDSWDIIYIFKGWKLETWHHLIGNSAVSNNTNNNEYVKKVNVADNTITSYRLTWVGY